MIKTVREICVSGAVIDVTIKGTKNPEKCRRSARKNPTPDAVRKNNDRIAVKNLARMMNANLYPGDYHVTLTYAEAVTRAMAEKELKLWIRRMKREFKKVGKEFKWFSVTEYKNHRIHHHVAMSYIDSCVIDKQWQNGHIWLSTLDKSRDYTKLAEYFVKETQQTFREADNATKKRYSCSRNLIKPIVVVQQVSIMQLFKDPVAFKGYDINPESVRKFDNPITGLTHLEYSMRSEDPVPRIKKWRKGKVAKRTESFSRFEQLKQLEFRDDDFWMK